MSPGTERDLLRLLTGRLPDGEARELEARMARDGELARAYARLAGSWQGLALPEPAPAPPGFATRVMARVREEAAGGQGLSLAGAPWPVRALAAAAVVVGITLGVAGVQLTRLPDGRGERFVAPPSLADSYWTAVEEEDLEGGEPPEGDEP